MARSHLRADACVEHRDVGNMFDRPEDAFELVDTALNADDSPTRMERH